MIVKKSVIISKLIEWLQMLIGIFLVFVFTITFFYAATDGVDDNNGYFVMYAIFIVLGLWAIVASRKRHRVVKCLKAIAGILSRDYTFTIEKLAGAIGRTEADLLNNIFQMFHYKYVNGLIDSEHSSFVFHQKGFDTVLSYEGLVKKTEDSPVLKETPDDAEIPGAAGTVAITCKNCGGVNIIRKGSTVECEYCGSPIGEEE